MGLSQEHACTGKVANIQSLIMTRSNVNFGVADKCHGIHAVIAASMHACTLQTEMIHT